MPAPFTCPRNTEERQVITYNARFRKLVKAIGETDLTNAVNGSPQDIPIGFLPPGVVMTTPPNLQLLAQFTGGGATSVGLTIGTAAAPTLVATNFNIFGAAASGLFVPMTQGAQVVSPGTHPTGGQNLIARITPTPATRSPTSRRARWCSKSTSLRPTPNTPPEEFNTCFAPYPTIPTS